MNRIQGTLDGLANFIIEHAVVVFVVATVICLTLVGYLTNSLNPAVMGVWIVVGILTSLLVSGVALVVLLAVTAVKKAKKYVVPFEPDKHLYDKDHFERERVNISDFYSKYAVVHENKSFVDCEIQGPGVIYLHENCEMPQMACAISDFVVIGEGSVINSAAHFRNTSFRNCKFSFVVVFTTEETARSIQKACKIDTGQDLPVVGL